MENNSLKTARTIRKMFIISVSFLIFGMILVVGAVVVSELFSVFGKDNQVLTGLTMGLIILIPIIQYIHAFLWRRFFKKHGSKTRFNPDTNLNYLFAGIFFAIVLLPIINVFAAKMIDFNTLRFSIMTGCIALSVLVWALIAMRLITKNLMENIHE